MCTSIAYHGKSFCFGRNMDIECSFGERLIVCGRSFPFKFRGFDAPIGHKAIIGVGTVIDGYPLYADAMNEKGLCIAGLNFPEKSFYQAPSEDKINVPAYDFIAYVAAKYSSVEDFKADFCNLNVTNESFSSDVPSPTLHWMISDNASSIVIESTERGINLYENPFNTMTNLPEFPEHIENYRKMRTEEGSTIADFPDMISSESRFLRTTHFLGNNLSDADPDSAISHVFSLLGIVSVPDGAKKTPNGRFHRTTYSACFDTHNQQYFIRTSENSRISSAILREKELTSSGLSVFEIPRRQDYLKLN